MEKRNSRMLKYIIFYSFLFIIINAQPTPSVTPTLLTESIVTNTPSVRKPSMDNLKQRLGLINTFKQRLLEMLNINEIPVNKIDMLNVPEPAMQEYKRLTEHVKPQDNTDEITDMQNDQPSYYKLAENIINSDLSKNEQIRFKSSFIQEISMLATVKRTDDWCSSNDKNLHIVSCLQFQLKQNEFYEYDLDYAELYFKLNQKQLQYVNSLYVSVNNEIVKKFQFSATTSDVYEFVELKEVLTGFIVNDLYLNKDFVKANKYECPKLNVKFLTDKDGDVNLFENFNEQAMLNVKFGERSVKQLEIQLQCGLSRYADSKFCLFFNNNPQNSEHAKTNSKTRSKRFLTFMGNNDSRPTSSGSHHHHSHNRQHNTDHRANSNLLSFVECNEIKSAPNSLKRCCRETIRISITEMGWQNWIAQPTEFEFKYCRGSCSSLSDVHAKFFHTKLLNRAMDLSHSAHLQTSSCCNIFDYESPTTILYKNSTNFVITQLVMSAKTCACS